MKEFDCSYALLKSAKFAKFCVAKVSEPNGSLFWSLNGSKFVSLNAAAWFDAASLLGGGGAALKGVLLVDLGGAGLGGGALLFFGGKAGVGLSDLPLEPSWFESKGEKPNGSSVCLQ